MALTDTRIRQLKAQDKAYKVADGGGLYIHVAVTGSKLWRMRYRFDGREQLLSFGAYPEVSLARARERRQDAKRLLAEGIDPAAQLKAEREERAVKTEHTFAKIADELVEKLRREGKADTTLLKKQWLLDMARRDFGDVPIREIAPAQILATLRKVEALGNYESAKRLRSTIGQVFRFAIATARADNDPTYPLRGALIAPKVPSDHGPAQGRWLACKREAGLPHLAARGAESTDETTKTRPSLAE